MDHRAHVNFYRQAALHHIELQNNDATKSQFFRGSREEVLSLPNNLIYPCLIFYDYRMDLLQDSTTDRYYNGTFEIRGNAADKLDEDSIEEVKEQCLKIGDDILQLMKYVSENEDRNPAYFGLFPKFNFNNVSISFTGPYGTQTYGVRFNYRVHDEAFNYHQFNKNNKFPTF